MDNYNYTFLEGYNSSENKNSCENQNNEYITKLYEFMSKINNKKINLTLGNGTQISYFENLICLYLILIRNQDDLSILKKRYDLSNDKLFKQSMDMINLNNLEELNLTFKSSTFGLFLIFNSLTYLIPIFIDDKSFSLKIEVKEINEIFDSNSFI